MWDSLRIKSVMSIIMVKSGQTMGFVIKILLLGEAAKGSNDGSPLDSSLVPSSEPILPA